MEHIYPKEKFGAGGRKNSRPKNKKKLPPV